MAAGGTSSQCFPNRKIAGRNASFGAHLRFVPSSVTPVACGACVPDSALTKLTMREMNVGFRKVFNCLPYAERCLGSTCTTSSAHGMAKRVTLLSLLKIRLNPRNSTLETMIAEKYSDVPSLLHLGQQINKLLLLPYFAPLAKCSVLTLIRTILFPAGT